ncbi:hypothetical protein J437_LFUL007069 [Ladona fulva]|uniref:Uncharacterized protein n=1 Tax=Ladona fulva TaxID=123851 RepID=A0A8K0K727_LADFU|nr:hypothetical protein J437_LFUL007069 [Ladona fulva]
MQGSLEQRYTIKFCIKPQQISYGHIENVDSSRRHSKMVRNKFNMRKALGGCQKYEKNLIDVKPVLDSGRRASVRLIADEIAEKFHRKDTVSLLPVVLACD